MRIGLLAIVATAIAFQATPAAAVEGGAGAYLLGSRDSLAGIVPPPGTYVSTDFIRLDGNVSFLALGGIPLVDARTTANVLKLNVTRSFDAVLWGGQPAVTLTLPVVSGELSFDANLEAIPGRLKDDRTGLGDLVITPGLGWSGGKLFWSASVPIFLPTGFYEKASVDVPDRSIQALSFGKNRVAFDPTVAFTYLDPENGRELSTAVGITFSFENEATDYQTAPEMHVEATAMQHLPNRLALGVTGYAYQQLGDDSGAGAESIKAATGQDSLEASVFGAGPILTYSTNVGGAPLSMKIKYIKEFEARKRFESDVIWATLSLSF